MTDTSIALTGGISFIAFLISYTGLVPALGGSARYILDQPNERSSHTQPTPRGGGLIIVAVTLLSGCVNIALLESVALC